MERIKEKYYSDKAKQKKAKMLIKIKNDTYNNTFQSFPFFILCLLTQHAKAATRCLVDLGNFSFFKGTTFSRRVTVSSVYTANWSWWSINSNVWRREIW